MELFCVGDALEPCRRGCLKAKCQLWKEGETNRKQTITELQTTPVADDKAADHAPGLQINFTAVPLKKMQTSKKPKDRGKENAPRGVSRAASSHEGEGR